MNLTKTLKEKVSTLYIFDSFKLDTGSTINCLTKSESSLCCILWIIIEITISKINKITKLKSFGFSSLIAIKSKIIIVAK